MMETNLKRHFIIYPFEIVLVELRNYIICALICIIALKSSKLHITLTIPEIDDMIMIFRIHLWISS
jgi:hypothetical protein